MEKVIMLSGAPVKMSDFSDMVTSRIAPQYSANQQNLKLAEYQYSKDLEMWNRQNEYNTPKAQMQRYSDAGLNPMLAVSQGSSGNATSAPNYHVPTVMPEGNGIPQMISMFQDLKIKEAQYNNVVANTEATKVRTLIDTIRQKDLSFDYDLKSEFGRQKFLNDFHMQNMEMSVADWRAAEAVDKLKSMNDFGRSPAMMQLEKYSSELAETLLRGEMLKKSKDMQEVEKMKLDWSWDKMKNMNPKIAGYVQMLQMLKNLVF